MTAKLSAEDIIRLAETDPTIAPNAIRDAKAGNRSALGYLRACVIPPEAQVTQPWEEDGPCAGYGCGTILIY